ncbi:hypothetical protein A616_28860 [Brevibacillus brevis X23]|nr:hypothetical protein A616_28860 [Brevibacillus brevis X23]
MYKKIKIAQSILGAKLKEFLERVPYLSEQIAMVRYNHEVHGLELEVIIEKEGEWEKLKKHIEDLMINIIDAKIVQEKIIKDNCSVQEQIIRDNDNPLKSEKFFSEFDILLMERLDQLFLKIAKKYSAIMREYPSILSPSNMAKNQYHLIFPQNVYGVTCLPHNYSIIKQIRDQNNEIIPNQLLASDGSYLQPCLCYHCYEENEGKNLTDLHVFTLKGKCFRHEISWKVSPFRRNEFTMREIVFIGDEEKVYDIREKIANESWALFEQLGLRGRIATSRDPFFHYDDLKTKGAVQLISFAKYELDAKLRNGEQTSIASFNYCQDLLCKKFGIRGGNGKTLHSGCVGFGIERWRGALLDRYEKNEIRKMLDF